MTEFELTQVEADALIKMEKHCLEPRPYDFPCTGEKLTVPLQSSDGREDFLFDISRGRIDLAKVKYQNRARQVIVLLRLDLGGGPHRNPDGEDIPCPHLHIYKEGFGDKWAIPLPPEYFTDTDDLLKLLEDFMLYCNITRRPTINRGLF